MRRITIAVVAWLVLSAVADAANFGRRTPRSSSGSNNGAWQKGYGWGGYGWYSANGDYVGYDGYSSIRAGYGRNYGGSPANFRPRFPDSVYDRANDGYRY